VTEFYKGARVVDPRNGVDDLFDFVVHEGCIERIGPSLNCPKGAREISLKNRLVIPGVVDMHVHLREPGTRGESIASGAAAALRGGVTSVVAMPNTEPPIDDITSLRSVRALAENSKGARVFFIAALTRGRDGELITEIPLLHEEGAVAFSDDGSPVMAAEVMRRAMLSARRVDSLVINHCEECTLAAGGVINEGAVSLKKGLRGQTHLAESVMVGRDLLLSGETGCRYHVAHLSTRSSLEQLRFARDKKFPVTAEVTPHHFILSDEDIPGYDTHYKMNPPLRSRQDVAAMIEGLQEGLIEVIASDHAPHPEDLKSLEFENAPFGIMGLETLLLLSLKYLVLPGHLSLPKTIACLTSRPAEILKLPTGHLSVGAPADFVVLNMEKSFRYNVDTSPSLSRNTPFHGEEFPFKIEASSVQGVFLFKAS
jgi:dihydroorotase